MYTFKHLDVEITSDKNTAKEVRKQVTKISKWIASKYVNECLMRVRYYRFNLQFNYAQAVCEW